MKRLAISGLVVGALMALGGVAHADPPDVAGFSCGFVTVTDPQNQGNQTGEVDSHFVTVDEPNVDPGPPPVVGANENPSHGHITCRFQTGSTYGAPGTVLASVTSPEQDTYVDLTATVSYPNPTVDVYICTIWGAGDSTVSASGDTIYYADPSGALVESTTTGAGATLCGLATSQEVDSSPVGDALCGLVALLPPPLDTTLGGLLGC